jgi:autophagy-related protein 16
MTLKGLNRTLTDVSFSMDNEYLAGASTEHKVVLWRLKTMRVAQTFSGHKETINSCKFAFVTKSLLTGSQDRSIKIFDVDRGTNTKTVSQLTLIIFQIMCFSSCFDIHISVQENNFASAHFDGSIRLWSVRGGELVHELK